MSDKQGDKLPDDLDVTKYVGPYQFPSPRRRRTAAYSIVVISILSIIAGLISDNPVLMIAGGLGICIGVVFFFTAWPLNVNDLEALTSAASQAPFSVGHASAQLSFTGWLSKPMWRVVVFSSDEPPTQRGLVEINAVNKTIASVFFDRNDDDSPRKRFHVRHPCRNTRSLRSPRSLQMLARMNRHHRIEVTDA